MENWDNKAWEKNVTYFLTVIIIWHKKSYKHPRLSSFISSLINWKEKFVGKGMIKIVMSPLLHYLNYEVRIWSKLYGKRVF